MRADRIFEYNPLVVTFADTFGLDAVVTGWPSFIALDPAFPARYCQPTLDSRIAVQGVSILESRQARG